MLKLKNLKLIILFGITAAIFVIIYFWSSQRFKVGTQEENCQTSPENLKQQCYAELLEKVSEKKGVQRGIEAFKQILSLRPTNCHGLAHKLGEVTYEQYQKGEKFSLNEDTLYCDFGFWHGFMGELTKNKKNNPSEIKKFCHFVNSSLIDSASVVESSCYHGVGIGSIEDPPDIKLWGNTNAIIDQSVRLCEAISDTGAQLSSCASGVFHGIIDIMTQNRFKFSFDKNNPLALCIGRQDYQKECFMQLAPKLPNRFKNDLSALFKSLDSVDSVLRADMLYIAAASLIQNSASVNQGSTLLQQCGQIPQDYQSRCIAGFVKGLFDSGEPSKEYTQALQFCKLAPDEHKKSCYREVVLLSKNIYPKNKLSQVCFAVDEDYRPADSCNI